MTTSGWSVTSRRSRTFEARIALIFHHRGTEVTEADKTRRSTHPVPEQSVGVVWTDTCRGGLLFPSLLCVLGASVVKNQGQADVSGLQSSVSKTLSTTSSNASRSCTVGFLFLPAA